MINPKFLDIKNILLSKDAYSDNFGLIQIAYESGMPFLEVSFIWFKLNLDVGEQTNIQEIMSRIIFKIVHLSYG